MEEELQSWHVSEAHDFLERIRRLGEDCAAMRGMVDDARARADGVRGIDYSAIRVSTSPSDGAMVEAIDEIRGRIREYVTLLAEYEGERARANDALTSMEDFTEASILRMRYLLGWKWERVCVEAGYSWDGMMKLRRRALESYWHVMPMEWRTPMEPAI